MGFLFFWVELGFGLAVLARMRGVRGGVGWVVKAWKRGPYYIKKTTLPNRLKKGIKY